MQTCYRRNVCSLAGVMNTLFCTYLSYFKVRSYQFNVVAFLSDAHLANSNQLISLTSTFSNNRRSLCLFPCYP